MPRKKIDTFGDKPQCLSLGKESRKPEGLKNGGFVALSINTEYTQNKFRKQTPMLAIGVYECVDIDAVISVLEKETGKFNLPAVSRISRQFKGPFYVLISCILSLRTQDKTTAGASLRLFRLAKNPAQILKLKVSDIERAIYPVGFYRTKAKRIRQICQTLKDKFSWGVPDTLDALLSLKGVGRKTANLVLTEGFGKLGICVDTHVHRITNRLGFCKTNSPEETEFCLRGKLPRKYWIEYNRLLVSWGQNICRPLSPLCSICAIEQFCHKIGLTRHR